VSAQPHAARFGDIAVTDDGPIRWLTLNRPERKNATTMRMLAELRAAMEEAGRDDDVRVVVLTGAGSTFCIGSDLSNLADCFESNDLSAFRDYLASINATCAAFEAAPLPVIAMVNGPARAGGFEMILACDFVVMADDARIGDDHTPFGHMPGAGATQRLPRKIGRQRALELLLTGRWIDAAEAVSYGIALSAVPRAALRDETRRLAASFADKARPSLRYIKQAVLRGWDLPLREGVQLETACYLEYLATSREPRERYRAGQARRLLRAQSLRS